MERVADCAAEGPQSAGVAGAERARGRPGEPLEPLMICPWEREAIDALRAFATLRGAGAVADSGEDRGDRATGASLVVMTHQDFERSLRDAAATRQDLVHGVADGTAAGHAHALELAGLAATRVPAWEAGAGDAPAGIGDAARGGLEAEAGRRSAETRGAEAGGVEAGGEARDAALARAAAAIRVRLISH